MLTSQVIWTVLFRISRWYKVLFSEPACAGGIAAVLDLAMNDIIIQVVINPGEILEISEGKWLRNTGGFKVVRGGARHFNHLVKLVNRIISVAMPRASLFRVRFPMGS